MAYLGYVSAALIATGVVIPLGLDIARVTNFAGYVTWCAWLVAMAIVLLRSNHHTHADTSPSGSAHYELGVTAKPPGTRETAT